MHLHPISETHQLRPTLTYIDILTRKTKRRIGADSDEDSDDGPPPDPDEPTPAPVPKKEKKAATEAKEVQVAVRKSDDKSMQLGGGLTTMRREMLIAIRAEEDEKWEDLEYYGSEVRTRQFSLDKTSLIHFLRHKSLAKHLKRYSRNIRKNWNARAMQHMY